MPKKKHYNGYNKGNGYNGRQDRSTNNNNGPDYAHAPYNFIPFSNKVDTPHIYAGRDDENFPPFDESFDDAYTGYVDFEMKNLTPISINQGLDSEDQGFYKNAQGQYIIPGATIRGFIRTHCELLSFSYPKFIRDQYFTYRDLAGRGSSKNQYTERVVKSKKSQNGKRFSELNNVQAGYIYKVKEQGTMHWYIQPVKAFGEYRKTFFKVHELDIRDKLDDNQKMYTSIDRRNPRNNRTNRYYAPYRSNRTVYFDYDKNRNCVTFDHEKFEGHLLNSMNIRGKLHHYLVSTEVESGVKPFEVDQEMILTYQNEFEDNFIKKNPGSKEVDPQDIRDFYCLPKEEGLENGKIFFYKKEKNKLIGFGATPYLRIFYDHHTSKGIPYTQKEGLDYTEALFGYTNDEGALKGRLSFRDAILDGSAIEYKEKRILSDPRGTSYQLYLEQHTTDVKQLKTYNDDFQLRGYKFYWKQKNAHAGDEGNGNEKIFSTLNCIEAGHTFKGRIYFNNLYSDELGLLLCALQYKKANVPEPETFLIGKGKPYGFGKIEVENVQVYTFYPEKENRFTSLNAYVDPEPMDAEIFKDDFRDLLLDTINRELKEGQFNNLEALPTYKTYLAYAKSGNMDDYLYENQQKTYMDVGDFRNRKPLQDANEIMKKYGK